MLSLPYPFRKGAPTSTAGRGTSLFHLVVKMAQHIKAVAV